MAEHDEMKQLEAHRQRLEALCKRLDADRAQSARELKDAQGKLKKVKAQISELVGRNAGVVITEHAVLRYVERVLGLSIEEIKKTMMPPETKKQIQTCQSGKFPVRDKDSDARWRLVAKRGQVRTVLVEEPET